MCYKYPGPRCSAYAKKKLIEAETQLKSTSFITDGYESYDAAKEAVNQAQIDYDSTPAGQKYLQFRIDQGMDSRGEHAERLKNGKKLRRMQLKAIESKESGDINDHPDMSQAWNDSGLESADADRIGWNLHPDGVESQIEQYNKISLSAAHILNADEQVALAWITSDGGPFINSKLIAKDEKPDNGWTWEQQSNVFQRAGYTPEFVQKKIRYLNSAFKKYSLDSPAVLYRGLNDWNFPDELQKYDSDPELLNKYLTEKYPVGETITVSEYMSTSVDPQIANKFTGGQKVVLEVSSKKAIPVGYMSAWGSVEREFILNKGSKYRVKQILQDVNYKTARKTRHGNSDGSDSKTTSVTVIQLEEIQ